MKIVLDSNVLLVSVPSKSKYRIIFDKFLSRHFELIISNDILTEYIELLSIKANSNVSANIAETLLFSKNVTMQQIYYNFNLIEIDKDDNKFVDCAIAGGADYIVTNDKHFNILKQIDFPKVSVISIDEFIELLKN
ncbi:MAG: putative toxin-antitoxin system toxin component, PIN family [Ignavibacteriae bacterium]|nr:putative toxin-antitoxin system toxin component, PIN family [Ignavibacteriota bacterium]